MELQKKKADLNITDITDESNNKIKIKVTKSNNKISEIPSNSRMILIGSGSGDDENYLPKSTVEKIIQKSLSPKKIYVQKDVKIFIRDAATLFLRKISTEANKHLEKENKKTMGVEHIYKSFKEFKFSQYIDECKKCVENYNEYTKMKPSKQNKFKESGMTMDQLHEEQMKLFNIAKVEADNQESEFMGLEGFEIENIEKINDNIDGECDIKKEDK